MNLVNVSDMPRILIGIPIKNCGAFLESIGKQLVNLDYDKSRIQVALVLGDCIDDSVSESKRLCQHLIESGFGSVYLNYLRTGFNLPHTSRHVPEFQASRLNGLAITRQFIIDNYLDGNDYVWWVDADYVEIPCHTLRKLVGYGLDFVIPNLRLPNGVLYDQGSMKGGKKLDEINGNDLVELDIASAHAFISAKIFKSAHYLGNPAEDKGFDCSMLISKKLYQEGDILSLRALNSGFKLYASKKTVITHAAVSGNVEEGPRDFAYPRDKRGVGIVDSYIKNLQRKPDQNGFWHYYNSLKSLDEIERIIKSSSEASKFAIDSDARQFD